MMQRIIVFLLLLLRLIHGHAQQPSVSLTLAQQQADFEIFKGALAEGHSGIFYFISKQAFEAKCDSVQKTFTNNAAKEVYFLKLRYLMCCLQHGHSGLSIPNPRAANYKMAVLDSNKLFLPFVLEIVNKQLVIKADCSKEQLFPPYAVVKSIHNLSAKKLLEQMLPYMTADRNNETYKYYTLGNYFYFHYLFSLFFPNEQGVKIELESSKTHFYVQLLKPSQIDSIYKVNNGVGVSKYSEQLAFNSAIQPNTAYLKIGSFYKGLIEQFGQQYERFLDSAFTQIQQTKANKLVLDIRNNEGGGDNYEYLLLSYLLQKPLQADKVFVPGTKFAYTKYSPGLSDDLKAYIENPKEFLENDSLLLLKEQYTGQSIPPVNEKAFKGQLIVLTNGGTFSAASNVVRKLYFARSQRENKRGILFVGEEPGGDVLANTCCAGQGYAVVLPNSQIKVDMPLLCAGEVNKNAPRKSILDYKKFNSVKHLRAKQDAVLQFALAN